MTLSHIPPDFDPDTYLEINEDVKRAGIDPLQHYLTHGIKEKRQYKRNDCFEKLYSFYVELEPNDQSAFDLFQRAWSTKFDNINTQGGFTGTNDERIHWLMKQVNIMNFKVLELGPLEAGHTFMLEKIGGAEVVAVEANAGAFLRCLIVKNHLNLSARFLLGDFEKLEYSSVKYDLIVASGILYHLKNPVEFISKISDSTDRLFIWTHYFEPDFSKWNPKLKTYLNGGKWEYEQPLSIIFDCNIFKLIKQNYGAALDWSGFCGGLDDYSYWMYKDELLDLLNRVGYKKVNIAFDHADHENGPCFCLYCEK